MLKTPPYGNRLFVPEFPLVFIFVGEPDCWEHSQEQLSLGFHNFLCLPSPDDATRYDWPIEGCYVSVIVFCLPTADQECRLLSWLCLYNPREIALRHWPSDNIIFRKKSHGR